MAKSRRSAATPLPGSRSCLESLDHRNHSSNATLPATQWTSNPRGWARCFRAFGDFWYESIIAPRLPRSACATTDSKFARRSQRAENHREVRHHPCPALAGCVHAWPAASAARSDPPPGLSATVLARAQTAYNPVSPVPPDKFSDLLSVRCGALARRID